MTTFVEAQAHQRLAGTMNDGGPAFPLSDPFRMGPGNETEMRRLAAGMSLRDHFAGQAMQGICAHDTTWGLSLPRIAEQAYAVADQMLKARGRS